jgi:hypothetical protein
MPTDHAGYVEDTLWVAVEPTLNRLTTSPIQASRGLPTRQMPTDHVSYAEDTIRVAEKPSMSRSTGKPHSGLPGPPGRLDGTPGLDARLQPHRRAGCRHGRHGEGL